VRDAHWSLFVSQTELESAFLNAMCGPVHREPLPKVLLSPKAASSLSKRVIAVLCLDVRNFCSTADTARASVFVCICAQMGRIFHV
jgi:hypothetical protein